MWSVKHMPLVFVIVWIISGRCIITVAQRDATQDQLAEFSGSQKEPALLTSSAGVFVDSITTTLTAGPIGPPVLQDSTLIELLAHFNREKITPRRVHDRGVGALGIFEVTNPIPEFTKAALFSKKGNTAEVVARFSLITVEQGSAETIRSARGFSVKFQTEEGVFDFVGNSVPVFPIRDPMLFPSLNHSTMRNPVTNVVNVNAVWDFFSSRPETTNAVIMINTDMGLPDGHEHMHGFSVNTYKLVNKDGDYVYCRFNFRTNQGFKSLSSEDAINLTATDPDYATRKLYNIIHDGKAPSWTFGMQVMTAEQVKELSFNPFDTTKFWPEEMFEFVEIGQLTLNENVRNYHTDVEQAAFCPSNLLPGIDPGPDKMLHARMFAYRDAQRYRLGVNYNQLPINAPKVPVQNYQRGGLSQTFRDPGPNYYPNRFNGPSEVPEAEILPYGVKCKVDRYDDKSDDPDTDYFGQPAEVWRSLDDDHKKRVVQSIAQSLSLAENFIQERALENFKKVGEDLAAMLIDAIKPSK